MTLVWMLMILGLMIFWLVYDRMHASVSKKIHNAFETHDYQSARQYMSGHRAQFLFGSFGCMLGKFDLMVVQDRKEEAEDLLHEMEAMPLADHEKATLYAKAFNFYLICDQPEQCRKYTDLIMNIHDQRSRSLRQAVRIAYETIYSHRTDHLDDILNIYAWKSFTGKAFLEYELACIYDNINDQENCDKYMKLYEAHDEELRLNPGINGVWMNH